jgi:hypothetical protein
MMMMVFFRGFATKKSARRFFLVELLFHLCEKQKGWPGGKFYKNLPMRYVLEFLAELQIKYH